MTEPPPPIQTASLTLIRFDRGRPEVFWARRRADRSFLGGCFAFFAGGQEPTDRALPTTLTSRDRGDDAPAAHASDPHTGVTRNEDVLRATALRECFEECGALFCESGLITSPAGSPRRARTLPAHLPSPLATHRLRYHFSRRTPSWMPPADTAFFTLRLSDEEARALDNLNAWLDPDEHDEGAWMPPQAALQSWEDGQALATTPIIGLLNAVAQDIEPARNTEAAPLPLDPNPQPVAEAVAYLGGVVVLPLRTATLPPATHTNTYLLGRSSFVIVDPGPDDPADRALLSAEIERRIAAGDTPQAVILTHHHRDHIGGAGLIAARFNLPIFAHPLSAPLLPHLKTRTLNHGETVALGEFGELEVLHTPGHAPGHIALYHEPSQSIFAGDLVTSQGTIIIDPPEGHMGDYLQSLHTLLAMQPRVLWPAHGAPIAAPEHLLSRYIDHRLAREAAVLAALQARPTPAVPEDLIAAVYPEIPRAIWPLAARSLLAHLLHLSEQRLATHHDNGSFVAT
ncbi:MBL fold metallo-hydrolase [Lujinxingia sediminis]|uniref:MBL fold metallo-hydrolase n=1 Tax=Lujinxingia sediminis TaxID=2480984 RepID=A0ABY0CN48_9DELT|nr:MBL fold metallo-hydrolase [Lujinxingia sediminis]RVU41382.1 MBL fold metallo-hydrolase [Lujinxingia sediminis]